LIIESVFLKTQGTEMNAVLKNLTHLSTQEKIQLVEDLWDDISEQTDITPTSAAARQEVLRRAAWRDANPGAGKALSQIVAELGVRL
jgi:putative addiction module component (TIGR02574 family)